MNPDLILQIILTAEQIALEIIRGIPIAEREKVWMQHQKNIQFWMDLFSKVFQTAPVIPKEKL